MRCGLDDSSGLALRLRAPFSPLFFRPHTAPTTSPPPQERAQQKPLNRPAPNSERWQFLMLLPDQLIRDIAFVVASPSTFSDSQELPLVSRDMFGEDNSWQVVADWLKGLDSHEVRQYFEGRRYTTRLGDHFAACIEYVLKYSSLLSPDPLFISQQVGGWTIQKEQSSRTLKKSKGDIGSFALEKGGMMSEVIVRLIENDVLIKRFSSYQINRKGRVKELCESDIERLMDDFKKSSFDYHASTDIQELVERWPKSLKGGNHTNAVRESMSKLPVLLGMDVSTQGIQKWRICCSVDLKHEDSTGNKNAKSINRSSSDRTLPNQLNVGKLTTEVDRKIHMSRICTSTTRKHIADKSTSKKKLNYVKRAEPTRTRRSRVAMEKGDTAGECDFLFKANAKQSMQGSLDYAWTHVHHWEVSVHFLLYVGPWEVSGLVTPGTSVWHHGGKRVFSSVEGIDPISTELYLGTFHHFLNTSVPADQRLVLDACCVAPSVGDTWLDRKRSMNSKLQLCRHPNTAAKISNLFHSSLPVSKRRSDSIQPGKMQETEYREYKPLRDPQLQRYEKYRADPSIIRVMPRALTKGYLFYEPQLWLSLCLQRDHATRLSSLTEAKREDNSKPPKYLSTSYLNVNHWMGWWVYASDFAEFARSYGHKDSMWYIAPRNEWLSPIVINSSEVHRCRRVFDVVGMLTMILKVGEEAALLQPSRERRFLVVEVCWNPDIGTAAATSIPGCNYTAGMQNHWQKHVVGSSEKKGRWVEVSRGFIVERTWPESRHQLAHGFTLSWSPVLLGWS
ncbi:hypothetical protein GOP47_0012210 [Adiantum capillus-veneris]|uniref:Uncharacterized protein n=1 Tax=Adiantum capillus-veneris TaxID=13818 RepID=A0A9D4UQR9_ADICA|nr:hypothetical protein GOP47_0012210 [Adiantum capillus-veneris]